MPFAERIRREAGIATMAVGLITEPRQAEEILTSGKADMIALGRGMLFNPRWPWHAAIGFGEQVHYRNTNARTRKCGPEISSSRGPRASPMLGQSFGQARCAPRP